MRTIDIKNLDEWLFDYFEGNLDISEKNNLIQFLHKNPAFKSDYEAWKNSYIKEPEIVFPGMNNLLQPEKSTKKWMKRGLGIITFIILFSVAWIYYQHSKSPAGTEYKNTKKTGETTNQIADSISQNISADKKSINISSLSKKEKTNETDSSNLGFTNMNSIEHEKKLLSDDSIKNTSTIIPTNNHIVLENNIIHLDTMEEIKNNSIINNLKQKENEKKIIAKPDEDSTKSKQKTKKEMKIIRLKNPGF